MIKRKKYKFPATGGHVPLAYGIGMGRTTSPSSKILKTLHKSNGFKPYEKIIGRLLLLVFFQKMQSIHAYKKPPRVRYLTTNLT
jgi:hypothetical protein